MDEVGERGKTSLQLSDERTEEDLRRIRRVGGGKSELSFFLSRGEESTGPAARMSEIVPEDLRLIVGNEGGTRVGRAGAPCGSKGREVVTGGLCRSRGGGVDTRRRSMRKLFFFVKVGCASLTSKPISSLLASVRAEDLRPSFGGAKRVLFSSDSFEGCSISCCSSKMSLLLIPSESGAEDLRRSIWGGSRESAD